MVRETWIAAFALAMATVATAGTTGVAEAREHHHHHHRPAAGTELGLAELSWPDTTRSAEARVATKVYGRAAGKGSRLGKLARGTRVAWTRIVSSHDRCRAWIEIVTIATSAAIPDCATGLRNTGTVCVSVPISDAK